MVNIHTFLTFLVISCRMLQLAVKAWAETVAVVMEDSNSSDDLEHFNMQFRINLTTTVLQEDPLVTKWEDCSKESMLKSLQEKNRTPEWYHAAAEKLAVSAKAICRVQHHSHWKVRMALASSCHLLLSRCCRFGSCFCCLFDNSWFKRNLSQVFSTPS